MNMKKIFLALLIIIALSSESFGSSGDVYVRQDVFDAKMEALFARLDAKIDAAIGELKKENGEIRGDIKALSARVDGLDKRMDNLEKRMDERFASFDKRLDNTNTFLYYLLVLLAALILLPPVNRWFEERKEAKKFTLDDIRKLIVEEIDSRLSARFSEELGVRG